MIRGVVPRIDHLRPFYTKTYVTVPKQRRRALEKAGEPLLKAETGRFIGFHDPFSNTAVVMLSNNRLLHSINVTFDISDYKHISLPSVEVPAVDDNVEIPLGLAAQPEEANSPNPISPQEARHQIQQLPNVAVHIEPLPPLPEPLPEVYEWDAWNSPEWQIHDGSPQPRPRPRYAFLTQIEQIERLSHNFAVYNAKLDTAIKELDRSKTADVAAHRHTGI